MEPVHFTTDDGVRLEGELRLPEGTAQGTAVICHPHPKHGGSKDHPILWAIRNELAGVRGLATLGFNFRGVMGSEGTFGGGHGETHDVRAAIDRVRRQAPDVPTVVCGWSFGANVALRESLEDERVTALVLLGLPLRPNDVTLPPLPTSVELRASGRPVMLIAGDGDPYCPVDELGPFAAAFGTAETAILRGTDHYLWRREKEAAAIAGSFIDRVLG